MSLAHRFTGVLCIKSKFCHCILAQQGLPIPSNSPSLREDAPYNLCKLKILNRNPNASEIRASRFCYVPAVVHRLLPKSDPAWTWKSWLVTSAWYLSYERWKRTFHEVCSFYDLLHFENVLGTKYHHMRLKLSMSFPSKSTLQASHLLCCKLKGSK